jgi:hypothetical protein
MDDFENYLKEQIEPVPKQNVDNMLDVEWMIGYNCAIERALSKYRDKICTMTFAFPLNNKAPHFPHQCSFCGRLYWSHGLDIKPNYCPHCGRKVVTDE